MGVIYQFQRFVLVETSVVVHVVLDVLQKLVPLFDQIVVGVHMGEADDPFLLAVVETVEVLLEIVGKVPPDLSFEGFLEFLQVLEVVLS